jgi:hypothetical protein
VHTGIEILQHAHLTPDRDERGVSWYGDAEPDDRRMTATSPFMTIG